MTLMGGLGSGRKAQEGGSICIHIADSLSYTTLSSNYIPIKKRDENGPTLPKLASIPHFCLVVLLLENLTILNIKMKVYLNGTKNCLRFMEAR